MSDARDRERDQQHDRVDLLDVGVRVGHELAGLRLVVEREVQPLQVREEPHAQVGLDAVREAERGVAAQAGADRLDDADREDDAGPFEGDVEVSRNNSFVDCLTGQPRDRVLVVHRSPARIPSQTHMRSGLVRRRG